ncbi:hypothetical protein V491_01217 [Pseudogymnoascus sp. VKM F-3775]|nr:hypothetical protein V491_01217 [Pseudogymnoascus sp. VKM F-3775]
MSNGEGRRDSNRKPLKLSMRPKHFKKPAPAEEPTPPEGITTINPDPPVAEVYPVEDGVNGHMNQPAEQDSGDELADEIHSL